MADAARADAIIGGERKQRRRYRRIVSVADTRWTSVDPWSLPIGPSSSSSSVRV